MTLMVLAIRLYDVGLRDDAVFWFYAGEGPVRDAGRQWPTSSRPQLAQVEDAVKNFAILAGPVINGYAFCDVAKQQEIRRRRSSGWSTIRTRRSSCRRCRRVPAIAKQNLQESDRRDHGRQPPRNGNTSRSRRTSRSSRRSARRTTPTGSTAGNERRREPRETVRASLLPRRPTPTRTCRCARTRASSGRLLGDVLRAQTGEPGYARIEAIRQTAVRFRRAVDGDAPAVRQELVALLNDLPIAQTLDIVRAFSYFSHLVNIAEDVHQNRRRRSHALAGSPPQRGSLADALDCVAGHGIDGARLAAWFADALVSPVLTAHPTEVQRKSILDCEREVARLLQWRDRGELTADEAAEFEAGLYRQVLALWQTAMIRLSKLNVQDEIENGLSYYRYTFLTQVPKLYLSLAAQLHAKFGVEPRRHRAALSAPRLVDRRRPRRQSERQQHDAFLRDRPPGDGRVHPLSRRDPPARRGALAFHAAGDAVGGAAASRRSRARSEPAPRRRALSAGADRRLRARRRHGPHARGLRSAARAARRSAAVRERGRASRRPAHRSKPRSRSTARRRSPTGGSCR